MSTPKLNSFFVDIKHNFCVELKNVDLNNLYKFIKFCPQICLFASYMVWKRSSSMVENFDEIDKELEVLKVENN